MSLKKESALTAVKKDASSKYERGTTCQWKV